MNILQTNLIAFQWDLETGLQKLLEIPNGLIDVDVLCNELSCCDGLLLNSGDTDTQLQFTKMSNWHKFNCLCLQCDLVPPWWEQHRTGQYNECSSRDIFYYTKNYSITLINYTHSLPSKPHCTCTELIYCNNVTHPSSTQSCLSWPSISISIISSVSLFDIPLCIYSC